MGLCKITPKHMETIMYKIEGMDIPSISTVCIDFESLNIADDTAFDLPNLGEDVSLTDNKFNSLDKPLEIEVFMDMEESREDDEQSAIVGIIPEEFFKSEPIADINDIAEDTQSEFSTRQVNANTMNIEELDESKDLNPLYPMENEYEDENVYEDIYEDSEEDSYEDTTELEDINLFEPFSHTKNMNDVSELEDGSVPATISLPNKINKPPTIQSTRKDISDSNTLTKNESTSTPTSNTLQEYVGKDVTGTNKIGDQPAEEKSNKPNYNDMSIDELQQYVRKFLLQHGVQEAPVPTLCVETEFGARNILKLIRNHFLLKRKDGYTMSN